MRLALIKTKNALIMDRLNQTKIKILTRTKSKMGRFVTF
jgi:hypothetical protein